VWLPFSVSTEELRQQYNFPSDTLVCADGAEYMHSLHQLFGQLYEEESTKIYKEKNQTKHERGSSEEKEYVFKQHFTNAYFGKNAFRYLPEKDMVSITSSGMIPTPPYPQLSEENGEEGTVVVNVLVAPGGNIVSVTKVKGSGYPRLDRAAMNAARVGSYKTKGWMNFRGTVVFKITN